LSAGKLLEVQVRIRIVSGVWKVGVSGVVEICFAGVGCERSEVAVLATARFVRIVIEVWV
jgi:hypothetical protein